MTSRRPAGPARRRATGSSVQHPVRIGGVGQVLAALEQRDDVQLRRLRLGGTASAASSWTAAMSAAEGEADHVPAAGLGPSAAGSPPSRGTSPAPRGSCAESAAAAPARSSASAAACTALCWRTSSSARWKPNVWACQISCCSSP